MSDETPIFTDLAVEWFRAPLDALPETEVAG